MEIAGLIWNESIHYIDHLAPFCSLLDCPLIVCEPTILELCTTFYPNLKLEYVPVRSLLNHLPPCLISCEPRPLLEISLRLKPDFYKIAWLPHGMSDKGWKLPWFEALEKEDWLLVYGSRMKQVLQAKKIAIPQISVGNFRYRYFLEHQTFYRQIVKKHLPAERLVLFAPTWEDSEENGTFFDAFPYFSSASQIAIKLHPNTEKAFLPQIERLKGSNENIHFIENFPPIYPILDQTDVYIGDMSSIGYDFLMFDRPLFFLRKKIAHPEKDPSSYLMKGGEQVLIQDLPSLLENWRNKKDFQSERFVLKREAFDKSPSTFLRFSNGRFSHPKSCLNTSCNSSNFPS